ncbi:hypothetical protein CRENBAI_011030 [Crenichthys baileyi]|uniref:Uncharacterized protein n=1 Tax=Crenichthys baileyi TaxID=28760 RepID=A0AAV9S7A4_9TELE
MEAAWKSLVTALSTKTPVAEEQGPLKDFLDQTNSSVSLSRYLPVHSQTLQTTHGPLKTTWLPLPQTHGSIATIIISLPFSHRLPLILVNHLSAHHTGKDLYHHR